MKGIRSVSLYKCVIIVGVFNRISVSEQQPNALFVNRFVLVHIYVRHSFVSLLLLTVFPFGYVMCCSFLLMDSRNFAEISVEALSMSCLSCLYTQHVCLCLCLYMSDLSVLFLLIVLLFGLGSSLFCLSLFYPSFVLLVILLILFLSPSPFCFLLLFCFLLPFLSLSFLPFLVRSSRHVKTRHPYSFDCKCKIVSN